MKLEDFKKQNIKNELGIIGDFGTICSFIDFGNVDYWFEGDVMDFDGNQIKEDEKYVIDLAKLADFLKSFSAQSRFYYGHDISTSKSLGFIAATKESFGKHLVFTKPIQYVRHRLKDGEEGEQTRKVKRDKEGSFVFLPKCNFDVEISVDAIRLAEKYDTFCLLSGDADFIGLAQYLKSNLGKKIIILKSGFIKTDLHNLANIVINAQDIKRYIAYKKQKSRP